MTIDKRLYSSIIQYSAGTDKQENLTNCEVLIRKAVTEAPEYIKGLPHLICLPEVFNFYSFALERSCRQELTLQNTEIIEEGQTREWAANLAKELNIYILCGSILETNPDCPERPYNTSFVISPEGAMIAKYRKINLFELKATADESSVEVEEIIEAKHRSHGSQLATFEINDIRLGLAICFDLRFPEIFMAYQNQGCEVIALPSAFLSSTGQYHWEVLCRARAIENQLFFIAPNQAHSTNCYGHSMIIDPWGQTIAQANGEDNQITSELLNISKVELIRSRISMHRKSVAQE